MLRQHSKWSQKQIGNRMQPPVKQSVISRWESGKLVPNFEQIARLAEILDVDIIELTTGSEDDIVTHALNLRVSVWANHVLGKGISEIPSYQEVHKILNYFQKIRVIDTSTTHENAEDLNRPVSAFLDSLFDTSSDKRQLQYGIAPNELPPRTQTMTQIAERIVNATDGELIISGSRGTGKTTLLWLLIHGLCVRHPGMKVMILRNEKASLKTTIFQTAKRLLQHGFAKTEENLFEPYGGEINTQQLNYRNGSAIYFYGMDEDASKARGFEGQLIWYNECQRQRNDGVWTTLVQCLRGTTSTWQTDDGRDKRIIIGDCNPDHPDHFLKKREARGQLTMVYTTLKDNIGYYRDGEWTQEGADYKHRLETGTPPGFRYRRDVLGEWCAAEGLVYAHFSHERHVRPIAREDIPDDWSWAGAIDWGWNVTCYCVFAMNPERDKVVAFKAIYMSELTTEDLHQRMTQLHNDFDIPPPLFIVADHRSDNNETLRRLGWQVQGATKSVAAGVDVGKVWLAKTVPPTDANAPISEGITFNENLLSHPPDIRLEELGECTEPLKEFGRYVYEERHKQRGDSRVDDNPKKEFDHFMDVWRYFLVALSETHAPVVFDWGGVIQQEEFYENTR